MSLTPETLADAVRTARENRGLTRMQLAERTGIGKTALFDLEHGNPGVRLNTLLAVLKELDLHLELPRRSDGSEPAASPPPVNPVETGSLPDHLL